jgi:transcriptional regulator with XRE-family HTH domain
MPTQETERIVTVLKTAMRILGVTNREVEKKLGVSYGYLSRLFAGSMELKVDHIVEITEAMGLHPAEFFQLVYPRLPDPPSAPAQKLRTALQGFQPGPPQAEPPGSDRRPTPDEIEKMMLASLRKLLSELGRPPESR